MRTALLLTLLLCLSFGWWQNHHASLGGDISTAKVLWLNLTLSFFFIIPAALWHDQRVMHTLRRTFGLFLTGFLLRALVEAPMLYRWQNWRCEYGITHDALMALLLLVMLRNASASDATTRSAARFGWLLVLVLGCEALNAWLFSRVADPQHGIYFAADSAEFRRIIQLTWLEVALLYPALLLWLRRHPQRA